MTRAELVADVTRKVQDASYTNTIIAGFFDQCRRELAGTFRLPALKTSVTLSTVAGLTALGLPDDYHREPYFCFSVTNNREQYVYDSLEQLLDTFPQDLGEGGTVLAVTVEGAAEAVAAQGTITLTDVPLADETFVVDTQTFTFKALRENDGEVTIGATAAETATNIVTAITADLTTVTAAATGATVLITSVTTGYCTLAFTESASNLTVDGNDLLGGTTQGCASSYLHYVRTPSAAESLRLHYYKLPTALSGDTSIPLEIPAHLQKPLLVGYACREIFMEVYEDEDNPTVGRYVALYDRALNDLKTYLGPYAKAPVSIAQGKNWGALV